MSELQFLIVNEQKSAQLRDSLESRVSFPVHQESEAEPAWNTLGGGKDDVFIFDRCGRLAFYVPFPISLVLPGYLPVVEDALRRTYEGSLCGLSCAPTPDRSARATTGASASRQQHSLGWRVLHMIIGGQEEENDVEECDERRALQFRMCCHPNSLANSAFCSQAPSCPELQASCGS
ncbi:selenoprotein Pb-like [Haemaphysalis longicornis]